MTDAAPVRIAGRIFVGGLLALVVLTTACGKEGPPLAPVHLVPDTVGAVSVGRVEDRARLRFTLPTRNANGVGQLDLERVEIYAITVAPGVAPPNRDLLNKKYLVGQIPVRPPPLEGGPPDPAPATEAADTRPGPGDTVTFEEALTPAMLTPVVLAGAGPQPAAAGPGGRGGAPGGTPAAPTPPTAPGAATAQAAGQPSAGEEKPADPVRIYVVRGSTRRGRPGSPSTRAQLPIVEPPPPPVGLTARFTGTVVTIDWKPAADAPTPAGYTVYAAAEASEPLSPSLVTSNQFEHPLEASGDSRCYRVRSVRTVSSTQIEGPLSEETCVTPLDTFPPAAPAGLQAVATPGQISLIWEAGTEKDLAGYLVLRGEAGGADLQALTPAPIQETSYRDTTVTPGVRYLYSVVAVDRATPPNVSAQAERREETAR